MSIRLSKAIRELNIGHPTAVEFLQKKLGLNDESIDVNYKLNDDQYKALVKAFKGDKKLKKVVIGKNVQTIGKSAFEKAGKLKAVTIKSTSLKKVGKNAFKGIHAKAKIKVPAKKLKAYQKLLKKKGQKASVKISK